MEHQDHEQAGGAREPYVKLAFSATLHCLLGCGLGEVLGMIIATAWAWNNFNSILLAVILGFVFGFILGMWPLLRGGIAFRPALRFVLIAEGLSIAVMEAAEVLAQVYIPGVLEAGLGEGIFWLGMLAALVAGFVAAFPVNLVLVNFGVRHQH